MIHLQCVQIRFNTNGNSAQVHPRVFLIVPLVSVEADLTYLFSILRTSLQKTMKKNANVFRGRHAVHSFSLSFYCFYEHVLPNWVEDARDVAPEYAIIVSLRSARFLGVKCTALVERPTGQSPRHWLCRSGTTPQVDRIFFYLWKCANIS